MVNGWRTDGRTPEHEFALSSPFEHDGLGELNALARKFTRTPFDILLIFIVKMNFH